LDIYQNILTMHGPLNVKRSNHLSRPSVMLYMDTESHYLPALFLSKQPQQNIFFHGLLHHVFIAILLLLYNYVLLHV